MPLLCNIEKLSILELKNRPKATFRFPPIYSCDSFLPFEKMHPAKHHKIWWENPGILTEGKGSVRLISLH